MYTVKIRSSDTAELNGKYATPVDSCSGGGGGWGVRQFVDLTLDLAISSPASIFDHFKWMEIEQEGHQINVSPGATRYYNNVLLLQKTHVYCSASQKNSICLLYSKKILPFDFAKQHRNVQLRSASDQFYAPLVNY